MNYVFLVIGTRPDGEYSAFWSGSIEEGSEMEPHPTLEPGGGGGPPEPPTYAIEHTDTCSNPDGAAAQVAATIMATDDAGPDEFDWTTAEFVATIVEKQPGVFGAYYSNVYSQGMLENARMRTPEASASVRGIVHNHPLALEDNTTDPRLQQRYPSFGDWEALDKLFARYGSSPGSSNPAIWIVDSFGVTRRFARSERAVIEGLSTEDRHAGAGLPGREVDDDDC